WDPAAFVGSTHVTGPERAALAALRDIGLLDVVPRPMKGPNPFTYWDYRAGMFHKDMGMRIDLVYATAPVAGAVTGAYIDREARPAGCTSWWVFRWPATPVRCRASSGTTGVRCSR